MNFISSRLIFVKTSSAEYSVKVGLPPMTLYGNLLSSKEQKYPSHLRIVRYISMSEQNEININYLHSVVLQESESDALQKINSDLYSSISQLIRSLKEKEHDGVEAKIKNALLDLLTGLTSFLLKLRLEKAVLDGSNKSVLLDEEKYILDSHKETTKRKETVLSGILNGNHSLIPRVD